MDYLASDVNILLKVGEEKVAMFSPVSLRVYGVISIPEESVYEGSSGPCGGGQVINY